MSWLRRSSVSIALLLACSGQGAASEEREALVMATAYNSVPNQTAGDPTEGAWGDRLWPGMRAIAISRDLEKMGLKRGVEVEIDGLAGRYKVLDRMARRWRKKIDIFMGEDIAAARTWGKRKVTIRWSGPPPQDSSAASD